MNERGHDLQPEEHQQDTHRHSRHSGGRITINYSCYPDEDAGLRTPHKTMYAKLSRYVRVFVTERQMEFLYKYEEKFPVLQTQFDVEDVETAQTMAAKGILVRKKLDTNTQYNLNKSIRFEDGNQ